MPDEMTIDELARAAGTTARNVRAYQTRGLIEPPAMAGRVGLYGRDHLARLRLIGRLQQRGYSLAAIADLLSAWEQRRSIGDVLGLDQALSVPYTTEEEGFVSAREVAVEFGGLADDDLARAIELELVIPQGDGFRVPSPRLLEVGAQLISAGVPLAAALDELAELREQAQRTAQRFVALFQTNVWQPWVDAGRPAERVPELVAALRAVRPLPLAAASAVLARAMDVVIADAIADGVVEAQDR